MRTRGHSGDQPSTDAGFTLIELMVALMIVLIAFVPLTTLFFSAMKTGAISANRTRAIALATRDLESYQSIPYCSIGYSVGPSATWVDGTTTYSAVDVATPPGTQPAQSGPPQTVAGTTYNFERHVVWVDAKSPSTSASTTYTKAYKLAVVIVTWSDQGSTQHRVRKESSIYPGALGTYSTAADCHAAGGPTASSPPVPVTGLAAAPNTTDAASRATAIDLSWTLPVGGCNCNNFVAVYTSDSYATTQTAATADALATSMTINGLAPATSYTFQLYSVQKATGVAKPSAAATASTDPATPSAGTCTMTSATTSLSAGSTNSGADQTSATNQTLVVPGTPVSPSVAPPTPTDVTLTVFTTGTCTFVRALYTPVAGDATPASLSLTQSQPNKWTGTLNGKTTNWSVGLHAISVQDASSTEIGSLNLPICVSGKATCP